MKFKITLEIEMTDEQVAEYLLDGLSDHEAGIPADVAQWFADEMFNKSKLSAYAEVINASTSS